MLIKKLSAVATVCGFFIFVATVQADTSAELQEMKKQIEALNKKIERQQSVHNEALTHYIKNEVDRALKARGTDLLTLGSNVENLTIKGDLRVRYEFRKSDTSSDARRDRFRQRFRLGFVWKTNEGWEVGAGITTGEGGAEKGATSANDTYAANTPFGQGALWLDYAYAKHKWGNTSLTLGQHKNPYINSGILFDSDVRFIGATLQWAGESGFFATGGAYVVQTFATAGGANDDANLVALQAGYKGGGFTAALAGYFFDDTASQVAGAGLSNEINMVSGYLAYEGKTDLFKYKIWGEYTVNYSANSSGASQVAIDGPKSTDPSGDNVGWALGAEIGVDKFKFKYMYGHFESDSMYGPLTDGDFATALDDNNGSLNAEGHKFGIGYKVTKNFEIAATYILTEEIISGTGKNDQGELFQIDFKYKF